MFGLSRLLDLAGYVTWRLNDGNARRSRRRAMLRLETLEDRTVPTLLGQQLFPADYPWNQDISNAPVAANSAAIIAHIGTSIGVHPDWGEDSSSNGSDPLYGIPVNVVHGNSTTKVSVVVDDYPDESDLLMVPIPANAVIEGDYQNGPNPNGPGSGAGQRGDSHLIIWDQDNNIAYELYGAARPSDPITMAGGSTGGVWHAAQESVWNMNANSFRTLGDTSADAAGLSILAGLARPDEGLPSAQGGQGAINHAIRFTLPSVDVNPQYIYPASHMVTVSSGSTRLPFGARLRLANTPAVNATIATLGPQAQIIAHAMQRYGLVLADIGTAMYVTGASASVTANNQIDLTWNMDDVLGLSALKSGDFQVVDLTPRVTGLSATTAAPGSTVTIIGQNFAGAAGHLSVLFGNTAAASVTYVDDSHITAIVPFGSGTVNVTVQSGVIAADPNDPNRNVKNPVFGYGTSAVTTSGQFTFGAIQTISATNSMVSFATSTAASGVGDTVTIVVKDTTGNAVGGLPNSAFHFSLAGGTSTGTFGAVSAAATQGTYTATFTGVAAGTASTLTATVGGVVLGTTPAVTVTAGAVSSANSTASFATPTVSVGNADTLNLVVKDAAGNAITGLSNGAFSFSLSAGLSAGAFGAVSETATPGAYASAFTGTTPGATSTLTVTIAGTPLTIHPTITVTTTTFTDDFGVAGSNGQLTSAWVNQLGSFQVNTSAHTATGAGSINLATVSALSGADEAVFATVTVTGTQRAGLVARHAGPGDRNMYYGKVVAAGSKYTAILYRNVGGTWATLYTQTYLGSVTNATLEFDVVGSSLRLFLNGSVIAYANDAALTAAGSVGMRSSAGAIMKNFSAAPLTLQNSASPSTFSDDFGTAGSNRQLRSFWFNQAGNFTVNPASHVAAGLAPVNLATVNGINNADEAVSATITLTGAQRAGLVARHVGPGDRNLYFGTVVAASGKYTAIIYRNVGGKWTTLFTRAYAGTVTNATLEFDVVGSSLRLFLNGSIIAYAFDTALTAAGSVGMRASAGALMSNFTAGPLTLSNQSLAFADNFNTPGANGQLKSAWFNRIGNVRTAPASAAIGVGATNIATVNGISVVNVAVQADIALSAIGQSAGLVTRYAGNGDQNMYLASVTQTGTNAFRAALYVNVNGRWTVLKSQAVASGTGTLRLAVNGSSLTVSYGGSVLFTAVDSSLSAAGAVGLRLTSGATADNFSAS